ncbi:helix-turn-helix domain-containing protein [Amycolatopsis rhabdoformis]|uniref:Helix-turn-helix domain-containing protein n=1 Tax=Amycolatopsis rhabdoformis TaxID=1448059 RepID=A0ABZ1IIT6_9PSEU|nr:helix-turn-helix domain-containing protein [Amycolatopsis rhabdoformis]WSE33588.1 helix-turn-helix domain-containing protein [Amycolatopsis rhabdoformis]
MNEPTVQQHHTIVDDGFPDYAEEEPMAVSGVLGGLERHRVAILVLPGTVGVDLAIPLQIFGPWPAYVAAEAPGLRNPYSVTLTGPEREPPIGAGLVATRVEPLSDLDRAHTIIVPGRQPVTGSLPPEVRAALRNAADRGARIVSLCIGAFVLAAAGLLDGRPATTHWQCAEELRRRYPFVDVREDRLYVDDGQILTSAGLLAGVDLCLHVLRTDLGSAAADTIARFLVSAPHRESKQPQVLRRPVGLADRSLECTRQWVRENLTDAHTLTTIAAHAGVSVRTLTRRFQAETGMTVMGWLTGQRVAEARRLLETTDRPIGFIGREVGFGSDEMFRTHFTGATGTTPARYRRAHRPLTAVPA